MSMSTSEEIVALFKKVAGELMGESYDSMTLTSRIGEYGIDSTSVFEIVTRIEDELNVRIPEDTLIEMRTVEDLVKAVQAEQRRAGGGGLEISGGGGPSD